MANSIAKQMADMAKWKGFTNPIVVVVASDSEVVVTVRGAFDPTLGNEVIEQAEAAIKEFLENE